MNKRLMIVIWNMGIGGIQKRMRDVVLDTSKNYRDWEVFFLVRRYASPNFLGQLYGRRHIHIVYYPFQTAIRFPMGFIVWVGVQYMRIKPRVVLTFLAQLTITMAIIKRLVFWLNTTLVINDGAYMSGYLRENSMEFLKPFLIRAYRSIDKVIVPTQACKNDLIQSFYVSSSKIAIVPNWTLLHPTRGNKQIYDCVYIGRLENEKNPLVMVDIVRALVPAIPKIRCAIVGDGKLKEQLLANITRNHLVSHINVISTTINALAMLKKSRLLIVPSLNEGMPNVVLEAAVCKVPAVANNFRGANEVIINGKTGFITDNLETMIGKIALLLDHPILLSRMGKEAQQYARAHFHSSRQKEFMSVLLRKA